MHRFDLTEYLEVFLDVETQSVELNKPRQWDYPVELTFAEAMALADLLNKRLAAVTTYRFVEA